MNRSTSCVLSTVDDESRPRCEEETVALESDVVSLGSINDITTWERLKTCFKPTYKLANKGLEQFFLLVFNFLITSVFFYIS